MAPAATQHPAAKNKLGRRAWALSPVASVAKRPYPWHSVQLVGALRTCRNAERARCQPIRFGGDGVNV
eukprot:3476240-Lingulodinium_polyedra.AAC.1